MAKHACRAFLLLALAACGGGSLPQPRLGGQPERAFVEVPYPPPAGKVEMVPPPPRRDAVWIDGQWLWQGHRWVWQLGGWVVPPRGARFSPWETRRLGDGQLVFAPAAWRDDSGREIAPPAILVPSAETTVAGDTTTRGDR